MRLFIVHLQAHPIHLWDACTGDLRCTYRAYDAADEVTAATSLAFSRDGSQLYGGFSKAIRIWDTSRPGRDYREVVTHQKKAEGLPGNIHVYNHATKSLNWIMRISLLPLENLVEESISSPLFAERKAIEICGSVSWFDFSWCPSQCLELIVSRKVKERGSHLLGRDTWCSSIGTKAYSCQNISSQIFQSYRTGSENFN